METTVESLLSPFRPTFRAIDQIDVNARYQAKEVDKITLKESYVDGDYIVKLPRELEEYRINPSTKRMPMNSINQGMAYVIFMRVSNIGTSREVRDRMVWSLDGVTGTLDHILYYSRKAGWKIIDFGNLRLDKEEKGVYSDAVEEHQKIYQHCVQQIGLELTMENMQTGFARKLSELEQANENKEKLLAKQHAELEALKAKMRKGEA